MPIKKNIFPDIAHNKVEYMLLSEWIGNESDLIKSMDASMDEVEESEWPDGLISYSCFLSNHKNKVLHCVQWGRQKDHPRYAEIHLPERLETLKNKIVVESEQSFGRFKLDKHHIHKKDFTPKFVLVDVENPLTSSKNLSKNISEYHLQNIDNDSSLLFAETDRIDRKLLSEPGITAYTLHRSYVLK